MYLLWIIVASAVVITAVVVVARQIKALKRRMAIKNQQWKNEQPARDWTYAIHSNQWQGWRKVLALGPAPTRSLQISGKGESLQKLLNNALAIYKMAEGNKQAHDKTTIQRRRLSRQLLAIKGEKDIMKQFAALELLLIDSYHLSNPAKIWITVRLTEIIPQVMTILLERVINEDHRKSLDEIERIAKERYGSEPPANIWDLPRVIEGEYNFPKDWNDLVARVIKNPARGSFRLSEKDPEPGELRQVAAEALRDDSFTQAKVVLAYCNAKGSRDKADQWKYRNEVGDNLLADLAKLVSRHHEIIATVKDATANKAGL